MIEVLAFGQPFSAGRIARILDATSEGVRAAFIPQGSYAKVLLRAARSGPTVLMRVGYRPGSSTTRGRLFDAYWSVLRRALPHAMACHYWLGTDVLDTLNEARAGTLRAATLASTRGDLHLSVAPWLATELTSVGIDATLALLPTPRSAPRIVPPMPSDFSVLTYLPSSRFAFYGGDAVLETARRLPEVRFDVVGGDGASTRSDPANVRWHGWAGDMSPRYAASSVVVRIPHHDGFGNTVIEGLLHARHVIYTQDVPFVRRVSGPTPEALTHEIAELHADHAAGRLGLNLDGRAYALETFDEAKLLGNLTSLLRSRAGDGSG